MEDIRKDIVKDIRQYHGKRFLPSKNGKMYVDEFSADKVVNRIMEIKGLYPDNCMAQAFDKDYYESLNLEQRIRLLTICLSGVANEDSSMGCYAMNPEEYDEFQPFFKKALAQYHRVDLTNRIHYTDWTLRSTYNVASLGFPALSIRCRVGRNLNAYPLPGAMNRRDRVNLEREMKNVWDWLMENPQFGGKYYSITPGHPCQISRAEYDQLVAEHIMFKDMSADSYLLAAGIAGDWPYGRGCYVSEDKGFVVWVGEEDHLRIICMKKTTVLNEVFQRLRTVLNVIYDEIPGGCARSPDYGNVTSCPTNMGTGMRCSVHVPLPNLTKDGTDKKAKAAAKQFGLSVRGLGGEHTPVGKDGTVDVSPSSRFCITESEIVTQMYNGLKQIKQLENAAK